MVLQLGQYQLSIRAKAPASSILLCSYRCNGFSGPLPISLCYICHHESKDHHELKAYNVTAAELQLKPIAQQGDPLEFRQPQRPKEETLE